MSFLSDLKLNTIRGKVEQHKILAQGENLVAAARAGIDEWPKQDANAPGVQLVDEKHDINKGLPSWWLLTDRRWLVCSEDDGAPHKIICTIDLGAISADEPRLPGMDVDVKSRTSGEKLWQLGFGLINAGTAKDFVTHVNQ